MQLGWGESGRLDACGRLLSRLLAVGREAKEAGSCVVFRKWAVSELPSLCLAPRDVVKCVKAARDLAQGSFPLPKAPSLSGLNSTFPLSAPPFFSAGYEGARYAQGFFAPISPLGHLWACGWGVYTGCVIRCGPGRERAGDEMWKGRVREEEEGKCWEKRVPDITGRCVRRATYTPTLCSTPLLKVQSSEICLLLVQSEQRSDDPCPNTSRLSSWRARVLVGATGSS